MSLVSPFEDVCFDTLSLIHLYFLLRDKETSKYTALDSSYEELISKTSYFTPTCYSFAAQVTAKKSIFNTKFSSNGKC